jgi:hypothetical protein
MIGRALALALAAAVPAAAEEGGPIRGGEHAGFTRLVLQVDPRTEWSLETGADRATVRFPGKPLVFSTGQVFERIPKRRVRDVTVTTRGAATEIVVELGCDCRISTSFVGARYLALDIADRGAPPPAVAPAPESAAARAEREATAVATAEELLIRQIERAAGQGLVELALTAPNAPAPAAAEPEPAAAAEAKPAAQPAAPAARDPIAAALDGEQIDAVTVYDRDDAREIARRALAAVPDACLDDAALDVGDWATLDPWPSQRAALRARLVGELDRPEAEGVRSLARFYVRTGFGAEAGALLAGFPRVDGLDDRALLADLARVVEGKDASPAGPLALPHPCPGRHALWLALGGVAPAFHDAGTFADVEAAFAELPADLRAALGPRLIGQLLDAARPGEARRLLDTSVRNGDMPTPALELGKARLLAAEGEPEAALEIFAVLAARRDTVALEALMRGVRLALDEGLPLPPEAVTDLGAAALEQRGTPREPELRALLVETLAERAELPAAVREARSAARELPGEAARFGRLAVAALAAADPQATQGAGYVETVLGAEDLIAAAPAADPARRSIAGRLVEIGLPSPALRLIAPALAAGDRRARLVGARSQLALGRGAAARATLAGLNGPAAATLRAEAFALDGAHDRALALLASRADAGADGHAWPGGAWQRVADAAAAPSGRRAMAAYMADGPRPEPAADPASLPPDLAFREPLPDLSRPSLDAARRLLAVGPKVGGLVAEALAEEQ